MVLVIILASDSYKSLKGQNTSFFCVLRVSTHTNTITVTMNDFVYFARINLLERARAKDVLPILDVVLASKIGRTTFDLAIAYSELI